MKRRFPLPPSCPSGATSGDDTLEPGGILVIMAKEPVPGRVKTRLVPPLTPVQAAALYRCLLEDTVDLAARVKVGRRGIAYSPPGARSWFRKLAPADFLLLPQSGEDLGERLQGVFLSLFDAGATAVCIMNSDGPDLPAAHVEEAFRLLEGGGAGAVFGPNPDGGFYLVGLRRPADLFGGVPWSTGRALEVSLANTRRAGLEAILLPPWPDLDGMDDLGAAFAGWKSGIVPPPARSYAFLSSFFDSECIP